MFRATLVFVVGLLAASPDAVRAGEAPYRTLPLESIAPTAGGGIDLGAFRGRVVYVDVWASWCRPCRRSFRWMEEIQQKYGERGLVVLAVNVDRDHDRAVEFLERMKPSFAVVFDPEAVLARALELDTMPSSFVFGADGELVRSCVGFRDADADAIEREIAALLDAAARPPAGAVR